MAKSEKIFPYEERNLSDLYFTHNHVMHETDDILLNVALSGVAVAAGIGLRLLGSLIPSEDPSVIKKAAKKALNWSGYTIGGTGIVGAGTFGLGLYQIGREHLKIDQVIVNKGGKATH